MTAPTLRPLSLGEVLDDGFGLYRSRFAPLLVVSVACQLLPNLAEIYLKLSGAMAPGELIPGSMGGSLLFGVLYLGISVVLNIIGVAATTYIVSSAYLGQETSAGAALGHALSMLGSLVLLSLSSSLVIGVGFLLFIIPGIILASGLMLSSVVMVLESSPAGAEGGRSRQRPSVMVAMNRSWELTRGFRFKVLVTVFAASLLLAVPSIAIGVVSGMVGDSVLGREGFLTLVLGSVLQVFVYPYIYTVITVLYYDLRVRKEGFDLELLAAAVQPA